MTNYTIITETTPQLETNHNISIDFTQKNGKLEINVNSDLDLVGQKEIFKIIEKLV